MMGLIIKFVLPIIGIILGIKYLKAALLEPESKTDERVSEGKTMKPQTIEICPECGYEKKARHCCKKS